MALPRKTSMMMALAFAAIALAGCGAFDGAGSDSPRTGVADGNFQVTEIDDVKCITWKLGYAGGLSCDWNGKARDNG